MLWEKKSGLWDEIAVGPIQGSCHTVRLYKLVMWFARAHTLETETESGILARLIIKETSRKLHLNVTHYKTTLKISTLELSLI